MDKNQRINQIEKLVDAIFLLSAYAHVRPLFKEVGLEVDGGLILFVSDCTRSEDVIKAFEICGCVKGRIYRNRVPSYPNYKLVLLENQPFYRRDVINEFLACKDFFPMLVLCGIMPEDMRWQRNIICLEHVVGDGMAYAEERGELFREFAEYSHGNADDLLETLKKFKASNTFKRINEKSALYTVLYSTAILYYYYRLSFVKNIEIKGAFFDYMESCISKLCESMETCDWDMEISSIVNHVIFKYFDESNNFLFGRLNSVEGKLLLAVRKESAILYDDEFYYVPEKLFREATKPLHPIISYTSIKRVMYQEGVLVCNDVFHNYTVKKILINAYGEAMRLRFLKLRRGIIDGEDGLSIVERRNITCT